MSIETRHTEKNLLFALLEAESTGDLKRAIRALTAIMEPEDVELVKKQFAEYLSEKQG